MDFLLKLIETADYHCSKCQLDFINTLGHLLNDYINITNTELNNHKETHE